MAKQVEKVLDAKPEGGGQVPKPTQRQEECADIYRSSHSFHRVHHGVYVHTHLKYNKKFTLVKEFVYLNLSKYV